MSTILKVENLDLELGGNAILSTLSCSFPKGKISIIIGPSGAGKSSLLQSITRLLPATGTITYNNQDLSQIDLKQFRREVIYVSQVPVVFDGTVADNINWGRVLWGLEPVDPEEILQLFGLDPEMAGRNAVDLSVGQQQRLHLARSVAMQPKILLLDEPASGLDAISKEVFEDLIKKLQREQKGLSIIMITHDIQQAKRMADYAILIDQGKMKFEAEAEDFFNNTEQSDAKILEELLHNQEEVS